MTVIECNSVISDDPEPAWAEQDYKPEYLLDGSTSTEWRSVQSENPTMPYTFVIDLGADGNTWINIGTWECPERTEPVVEFEVKPMRGRYLKFCVDETFSTTTHNAIAELNFWGE